VSALQAVRGTHDLIGEDQRRHAHVVATARRISELYGFAEWSTPIFEDTRVFSRTLGETSDVVSKEMYSFTDRGGDSLTLRPEGTASVCRALVTNGLTQSLPQKVFYNGPMFRYERPQKGRYRQFHQIGAELIGASEPVADAEVIAMGRDILEALGIAKDTVLELNTLGDPQSRAAWRDGLVAYFQGVKGQLSEDSLTRLERNPMRILDSKAPQDRALLDDAPMLDAFLTPEARTFWDGLRRALDLFKVPFRENPRIVRGLDYYSHTAFEFVTERLGSQGTVLAGGRYEGLVAEMGGPPTPAIGWAGGIERLSMLLEQAPAAPRSVAIVPTGDDVAPVALSVLQALRQAGVRAEADYRGSLKKRMERAGKTNACFAVVLGGEEVARGVVQLRDLDNRAQEEVAIDALPALLAARLGL